MRKEIKRSVCPYDCPDACGLLVEVADGQQAVKVFGDPEHPNTKGTLCPKMNHYERTVHAPDRLTQPLLRTGKKGEGSFRPISWGEAIQRITEHWLEIIAKDTGEAILPYSYAGTMGMVQRSCGEAFFHRLGASRLARTICSSAKGYGWSLVMGNSFGLHPDEAEKSDLIILWGTNALATNIHMLNRVRKGKKRGAQVWLVDTYETPTGQFADQVVLVRPGTDAALALGLMHILCRDGQIDQAFINKNVQGFEDLRTEILPDYSPARTSQITGVEVSLLEKMALNYAKAQAPFISLGSGLSRYGNGAMTVRTITCLPALTGAWSKPGGGLFTNVATAKAFNHSVITREDFMLKPTRMVNMNQLGSALTELSNPPIKSLYVYHSNPAVVAPDQNKIIEGLKRDDLFCIVHERFMTDTAYYADIILPATSSLEHPDLYRSYGHYVIQKVSAVIPPIGEAKSNWEVFQLLAESMGFEEPYFSQTAENLIDQLIDQPTSWLKQTNLKKLMDGFSVELPLPKDHKTTYHTPSGKIEIFNSNDLEPLPRYLEPYGGDEPFWLMSAPSIYSLNSSFNERPELVQKKKEAYLLISPQDAKNRNLRNNEKVLAFNKQGEVEFLLQISDKVPQGVLVTEGLFWNKDVPGDRTVNALTSQRLTDRAEASTLYDVKVDIRPINKMPLLL